MKINNLIVVKNLGDWSTHSLHVHKPQLSIRIELIIVYFIPNLKKIIIDQNAEIVNNGMAGQTETWL
jgi:hypothetical protein